MCDGANKYVDHNKTQIQSKPDKKQNVDLL